MSVPRGWIAGFAGLLAGAGILLASAFGLGPSPGPVPAAAPPQPAPPWTGEGVPPWFGGPEPAFRSGAAAAALIDLRTGQLLYAKNAEKRRDPASLTKIMTAVLALEEEDPSRPVRISEQAARTPGSRLGIRPGEVYSLGDLIRGMLLPSGNDAAVAVAEALGGGAGEFARMMNAKAVQIGLARTRFANPHGLTAPGHYSTAYDMALLARYAMNLPEFQREVCTHQAEICGIGPDGRARPHRVTNTNRLLFSYEWADGVKTGTTNAAGNCLIASASLGDERYIAVVLDAGDRWTEARRLLEFGFEHFDTRRWGGRHASVGIEVPLEDGLQRKVPARLRRETWITYPSDRRADLSVHVHPDPLHAPVYRGQTIARMGFQLDGEPLLSVPLEAAETVPRWTPLNWLRERLGFLGAGVSLQPGPRDRRG